jgi:hypothetical protein
VCTTTKGTISISIKRKAWCERAYVPEGVDACEESERKDDEDGGEHQKEPPLDHDGAASTKEHHQWWQRVAYDDHVGDRGAPGEDDDGDIDRDLCGAPKDRMGKFLI